jgi:hypothetical protein
MASQGPNSGTTALNDTTEGTLSWSSPLSCLVGGGGSATATKIDTGGPLSAITHLLKPTGFGFSIPAEAVIDGILLEVYRFASGSGEAGDNTVKLVKAGVPVGSDLAFAGSYPSSGSYWSYGGASNLWGTTWTPAQINAANFGAAIGASLLVAEEENVTASIDHVRITVFYTGGVEAGGGGMFQVF